MVCALEEGTGSSGVGCAARGCGSFCPVPHAPLCDSSILGSLPEAWRTRPLLHRGRESAHQHLGNVTTVRQATPCARSIADKPDGFEARAFCIYRRIRQYLDSAAHLAASLPF